MSTQVQEFPLRHVIALYANLKLVEWGEDDDSWMELMSWMVFGDRLFLDAETFSVVRGQLLKQFPWLSSLDGYQGEIRDGYPLISARTWALVDRLEERHGRTVPVMPVPPESLPQQPTIDMVEVKIELDPSRGDLPSQLLRRIRDVIADQIRKERDFGESGEENPW